MDNGSGHGGKRNGAGRPKGAKNKWQRVSYMVTGQHKTPLEVMLKEMNLHYDLAQQAEDAGDMETCAKHLTLARMAARDAAPFVHPKLQAVVATIANTNRTVDANDARNKLERLIATDAALIGTEGGSGRTN